jgi:2'-hydroxyisoflavone reductase
VRLLVFGGTVFLGRHVVEEALRRGHRVTTFNRGRSGPDVSPDIERLRGDRDGDLSPLERGQWDAVVDTALLPRWVRDAAGLLAERTAHYTYVSSASVYRDVSGPDVDESAPLEELPPDDPHTEDVETHYGALKAESERAAEDTLPGRVLHVRAGLIVGPDDPTGRFTYWAHRMARGGDVLAPEPRDQRVQFIDVRDLAAWIVDMAEAGGTGTFNATGPSEPLTMEAFLESCVRATGGRATLVWVSEDFLAGHGVGPWMDLPLWLSPRTHPELAGLLSLDIRPAVAAGLRFRPLEATIEATVERSSTTPDAGLNEARERDLLRAWDADRD